MLTSDLLDKGRIATYASEFQNRSPYEYVAMERLFPDAELRACADEVNEFIESIPVEKDIYASRRKHKLSKLEDMPSNCKALVSYLNSKEFIAKLEQITGIDNLHPDPELHGGGIHAIGRGGFLKIHTDFNWHGKLKLHRRLNLLVYLNENWQEDWAGAIELWSPDASTRIAEVYPHLGNSLLFATSDRSYHGHPDPLTCPEGVFRRSIAMYYYSPDRPADEIRFGHSEMTNYVERPGEAFGSDRLRRYRHKLQFAMKQVINKFR